MQVRYVRVSFMGRRAAAQAAPATWGHAIHCIRGSSNHHGSGCRSSADMALRVLRHQLESFLYVSTVMVLTIGCVTSYTCCQHVGFVLVEQ